MNNDKTAQVLDTIGYMIRRLHDAYRAGRDYGQEFQSLLETMNNAYADRLISHKMVQQYRELLGQFRQGTSEKIQALTYLNQRDIQKYDDAIQKLDVDLEMPGNIAEHVDKQDDSKAELNLINELALRHEEEYKEHEKLGLDEMRSVDSLGRIGRQIKKALEENRISRKTAEELLEPLQEIKDNLFDRELHEDRMRKFHEKLDNALSQENGKNEPEKDDVAQNEFGNTRLGTFINDAAVMGRNIGRVAKGIGNMVKREFGDLTEELSDIKADITKRYKRAMAYSRMYALPKTARGNAEVASILKPLVDELNDDKNFDKEKFKQDFNKAMDEMAQIAPELEAIGGMYDDVWDNINQLDSSVNDLMNRKEVKEQNIDQQREMRAADVVQKPDEKRKLAEEQPQQDKARDTRNLKKPDPEKEQQVKEQAQKKAEEAKITPEQAKKNLQDLVAQYGQAYQEYLSADLRSARLPADEFIKLADVYSEYVDAGVLPKEMQEGFRQALSDIQQHYLMQEHQEKAIAEMQNLVGANTAKGDVAAHEGADPKKTEEAHKKVEEFTQKRQRPMRAGDVVQSPADDKRKLNDETQQQGFSEKLQEFTDTYNKLMEEGNVGEANYEIDKLHRFINSSARDGVIPQGLASQYKKVLQSQYGTSEPDKDKFMSDFTAVGQRYEDRHKEQKVEQPMEHNGEYGEDAIDKQQGFRDAVQNVLDKREKEREMRANDVAQRPDENRKLEDDKEREERQVNKADNFRDAVQRVLDKAEREREEKEEKRKKGKLLVDQILRGKVNI